MITGRWKATYSQQSKNKKGDDLIILVESIFMKTVKINVENQTHKHKLTNAFFQPQNSRFMCWIDIHTKWEMQPHVCYVNVGIL